MPEDVTQQPTAPPAPATAEGTPSPSTAAATAPDKAAEPAPDLSILDRLSPEDLMHHPRVAGIFGDRLQRERERITAEATTAAESKARDMATAAERQRLRDLRRSDPVGYAQEMDLKEELEEKDQQLTRLRGETKAQFARRIGETLGAMDEWKDLTTDDFAAIQQAVVGKDDDAALASFVSAAVDLLGHKRSDRQVKAEYEKRLTQEKQAWATEREAERLRGEASPDISRSKGTPGKFEPARIKGDKEFNKWYEENILSRR